MSAAISESLSLISRELLATLLEARQVLEAYVDSDGGGADLGHCADLLHSASGALQMVEAHGASLLAEEMEKTCRHIAGGEQAAPSDQRVDALTRAIVQLPAYVETIMTGGRDIPLVLLPLLNDLRATRDKPLLSESTLLLLDSSLSVVDGGAVSRSDPSGEDVVLVAAKLRTRFQLGLLGWIKGANSTADLAAMRQVALRLEQAATIAEVHQLWWVVGGVVESLESGGLETSVALKRLMGQADREIKRLAEQGEKEFAATPPTDLINNLLYYVARAKEPGERISQIREAFNLNNLIPGDEQVEQLRQALAAPSANLMRTVADAIRQDLTNAKDVLDIYARTGMESVAELEPQVEMLRKISDTLGVLGLSELRDIVAKRSRDLGEIVQQGGAPEDRTLVELAASLLSVEDQLDEELISLVEPQQPNADEDELEVNVDADYQLVVQSVMRECVVNIARIKEAINSVMGHSEDRSNVDELEVLLSGIYAGLAMLGRERALQITQQAGHHIVGFVRHGDAHRPLENLNRLADSIVSIEYYMETIQNGRKAPEYMLDNAARCLDSIDEAAAPEQVAHDEVEHDATVKLQVDDFVSETTGDKTEVLEAPRIESTEVMETLVIDDSDAGAAVGGTEVLPRIDELGEQPTVEMPALVVLKSGDDAPDPELLEIFLEEAKECVEAIQKEFPAWEKDADAEESLATVRRSYHTLKGSGRMVGAELVGEYAWSIENLFNRIINNTLELTPEILGLLNQAVAATPEMIEQLEVGTEPHSNVAAIIHNAHGYADGGENFVAVPIDTASTEAPEHGDMLPESELIPDEPVASADAMDPVLLDILTKESATHIATLRDYIADCRQSAPPFSVTKDAYRACHTLQGSMTMADAVPAIGLATAMNALLQHAKEQNAMLGREAIDALDNGATCLETIVAGLSEPAGAEPDSAIHIQALERVKDDIPTLSSLVTEAPESKVDVPAEDDSLTDFDPEIAAIFAEEAAEILDAADSSLIRLSNNFRDPEPLSELLRHLHTLKGGARMAGVQPIGDFSHEIEEYLGRCAEGSRELTPDAVRLLQNGFDELQRMRDEVVSGRVVPAAESLQTELAGLIGGDASDDVASHDPGYGEDLTVDMPIPVGQFKTGAADDSDDTVEMPLPESIPVDDPAAEGTTNDVSLPDVEEDDFGFSAETDDADDEASDTDIAAASGMSAVNDKLAELARDFKSPAVPDTGDIVQNLGLPDSRQPVDEPAERPAEADEQPIAATAEPDDAAAIAAAARDFTRVDSGVLENMLNSAGEISIFHSRLNQQLGLIQFNLEELGTTVTRLREQLRAMDMETEAQILHGHKTEDSDKEEFDPLELDRYSAIQQLSRALAESSNDVSSIRDLLQNLSRETESLLGQQARTVAELQDNLMRTRMVPFQQHVPRLSRLVRQTAQEVGKKAELVVQGGTGELDRQVLEKMLPPFEHMLRNAVIHGIETPEERRAANKNETGRIGIRLRREGSEVIIEVSDDGAGLNVDDIREQAGQQGDLSDTQVISDEAAMRLILRSGLTTAKQLTQAAGRGIGMDVVLNEVAKLGGTLGINSDPGSGSRFTVRLPYTLAVAQALIVQISEETYALPMTSIEGVIRVPRAEFDEYISQPVPEIEYGNTTYMFRHLGHYLGMPEAGMPQDAEFVSIILVKTEEESVALLTDKTVDSREIVVKPVGPQLATVRGVSGATILGDGRIVIILDVSVLVRSMPMAEDSTPLIAEAPQEYVPLAMVVDDSITMRRVSQRLLERHGLRVITATDGVDALECLEDGLPDVILLDIEMPRMDGYEFASKLRNNDDTKKIPIIMVTSRSGEKHRARAIELGVNDYLGKPYQEQEMLEAVRSLLGDKAPADL